MKRCPICDWPLVDDPKDGCVDGNCSYRPDPQTSPDEYARIQRNREALAERQAEDNRHCRDVFADNVKYGGMP